MSIETGIECGDCFSPDCENVGGDLPCPYNEDDES